MQLVQGSTTVNFGADRDTDFVTETEQTEHKFLGSTTTVIQTNKYGSAVRQLSGIVSDKATRDALNAIHKAQQVCSFTGDQAGDTANVFIRSLTWERVFDIRNWQKRRFTLTLWKR